MEKTNCDVTRIGGAEIVIAKDCFKVVPDKISEVSKEGAIVLCYDKNLKDYAVKIGEHLRCLKRRIFLCELSKSGETSDALPDFIRYVIGVGCGFACQKAHALAKGLGVPWSLFLTAPTTDTILQDKSPKHVFIDENVMINCPSSCVAAGFGVLYSQGLTAFENVFRRDVLSLDVPCSQQVEIKGDMSNVALALCLLELSSIKHGEDSADIAAKILYAKKLAQGEKPRLVGEYKFIVSSYLALLYSSLLSSPATDVLPPPKRLDALDALADTCYKNAPNPAKCIDFFEINSYFRISYILSEYRTDLIERLSSIDLHKAQRTWRRIYDDAGYFLKSALTVKDVRQAVELAGSVSDNLLGYLYATGVLTSIAS